MEFKERDFIYPFTYLVNTIYHQKICLGLKRCARRSASEVHFGCVFIWCPGRRLLVSAMATVRAGLGAGLGQFAEGTGLGAGRGALACQPPTCCWPAGHGASAAGRRLPGRRESRTRWALVCASSSSPAPRAAASTSNQEESRRAEGGSRAVSLLLLLLFWPSSTA